MLISEKNNDDNNRATEVKLYSFDQIEGECMKSEVGNKAYMLSLLKSAGFPVPEGYCVPYSVFEIYSRTNEILAGVVDQIINIKQLLGGKVAIRSSANVEDSDNLTMAGVFESYFVFHDNEVLPAIEKIYAQSRSAEVADYLMLYGMSQKQLKMSLVVQKLVEADYSGVVYTGVNEDHILVQYFDGYRSTLLDEGTDKGTSIIINEIGELVESKAFDRRPLPKAVLRQIFQLSMEIIRYNKGRNQDIEFCIKNGVVSILQSRPLTTELKNVEIHETVEECLEITKQKLLDLVQKEKDELGTRTAIFSDANYSELLPNPTEMDIGIYMYIFTGIDGVPGATQKARNEMGYLNGHESIGIINYIGGKAYFSIARNAALYHIGFPDNKQEYFTVLVNEYLEAIEKDPQKGSYPQMGLYLQDPTPEDLEERFGLKAPHYYKVYTEFVKGMDMLAHNFLEQFEHKERKSINAFIEEQRKLDINILSSKELTDYCIKILEHLRNTTCINFVKAARLGFYYSQKVIKLLQNKFSMDKEDASKAFSNLTQGLDGSAITNLNISIAEAETDEEALSIAKKRMGHFSTGEMLEIRHPRMRDVPGVLHTYVKGIRDSGQYVELFSKQKMERLILQDQLLAALEEKDRENVALIFKHAQTYMALRETIKYLFSMEYSLIKDGLELLEAKLELNSGDIYYLFPREIVECEMDLKSMVHLIESRKRSFQNYKKLEMPDVIRENDIHHLSVLNNHSVDFDELIGSFLAQGQPVEGVVLNLDEIISFEEAYRVITEVHEKKEKIILVATQMNLTHDPFIALSDGLVIEKAGIVAHGAQRARELGKGAIGGVKSSILTTGMRVLFDPDKKSIRKMKGKN